LDNLIVIFRPCKYHFKKDIEFVCEISDLYHQSNYDGLYFCLNSNKNHILIKSLGLVMDGVSVKQYKRLILDAIEMIKMRHKIAIFFFDQLAKFSPGIGLVGTVIGLIQVLISMDKNVSLVNGMSVALITTLYGVILSNLIFQPMAGRLLVLDQSEERYNLMLLMGFISLLEGCSSLEIKERMMMVVNSQEVEIK
ncbi:MAG: MotA/TolQ/ExbB proton channel family protein, partial [Candidatus Margulisiibacteriota bacterium]